MATTSSFSMTIDGKSVGATGNATYEVINPFDGKGFAAAPDASKDDLDQAVQAAKKAFPGWAATSWKERQKKLLELSAAIVENKDALAQLLTKEQGKSIQASMGEILGSARWMQLASQQEQPDKILIENEKTIVKQVYSPLGVVGAIVAWNFPVILIHFKIAEALLSGCTVVLKPSEHTPLCALEIGKIYSSVLPPGVFNVVSGSSKELGKWLVEHPKVDKVSFTGSTETGKAIMRTAAGALKRVTLELGGNDPAIILDDVDPKKIAPMIFSKAFDNSGQVCMALKRVFVKDTMYEEFVQAMKQVASSEETKFGNGLQKGTVYGPVNNEMQYEKVRDLLIDAVNNGGAKIEHGEIPPSAKETEGYLFKPVIVSGIKEGVRLVDEEQFGPVLPILSYKSEEEVIERANATPFGLGASVWTADPSRGEHVANQLNAGTTWVNQHANIIDGTPFGGSKQSGVGVEGGEEGLKMFLQSHVRKISKKPPKFAKL